MTIVSRFVSLSLISLWCCGILVAGTEVKWKNVKDPILGDALFHLYQDKNLSGIIQLSADRQLGRVKLQKEEAELALTMLNLAYGLHREAASNLVTIQKRGNINKDISNHIWFYIAKIRYQRGYFAMAESALSQISGALPWELEQDLQLFMALLLMDRGEFLPASKVLDQIKGNTGAVPFARFNSAVSLVQNEEMEKALATLQRVSDLKFTTEQEKYLRDRANIYLGYYQLLEEENPEKSIAYFEKVHLYGVESNEALLGLGWAHYALEQYEQALVSWAELSTRNASDPNVQEAMVAVPFTLAKNKSYASSADLYNRALDTFHTEVKNIDNTIISVKKGAFFDKLLTDISEGEKGWNGDVYSLPKSRESYYFTQMLARHDYQEALKNYRDLRYLQSKLNDWRHDLKTFDDTNHYWIDNLLNRAKSFDQQRFEQTATQLKNTRVQLMSQLAEIEASQDAMALASGKEQRQLAKVVELKASLELGASRNPSAKQQRRQLSLMERQILWGIHSRFSSRLRKAKQSLDEVVSNIEQSSKRNQALDGVVAKAVAHARTFDGRISQTNGKINGLQPQISHAIKETEAHLINIAVVALEERRTQLKAFIAQVSFSVGASYDGGQ